MHKKRFLLLAGFAVLCVGSWWVIHQMGKAEAKVRVVSCMTNLRCIGQAIKSYRDQNGGSYPNSLQELYPKYLEDRKRLRCLADFTATSREIGATSYLYFKPDGSTNATQIIARDKPGNHHGLNGYAVLYANGETEWVSTNTMAEARK